MGSLDMLTHTIAGIATARLRLVWQDLKRHACTMQRLWTEL